LLFRCVVYLFFSLQPLAPGLTRASGPGTGSADFLKIPVGARETSLGGAFTAVADNANAVYYNPAGLGLLQNPEISFTHNKFVEGISQQWFAAAYPYKTGAFGLGINYLSVSPFDAYDNADNPTGSVSAYDAAAYLSWGGRSPLDYKFLRSVSYGASAKYISEKLAAQTGTGYGLDLGFLAETRLENLRFGFNVENAVSTEIKFIEAGARPPLRFKTGVMYEIRSSAVSAARFALDYVFPADRPGYLAAGMEHNFYDALTVRMGYSSFGDISNGFNFGLGFDLDRYIGRSISVDYSFGATYAFGEIHKLGVTYKFGPRRISGASAARPAAPASVPADGKTNTAVSTAAVRLTPEETPISHYIDTFNTGSLYQKRSVVPELGVRGGNDSFKLLLTILKDDNPVIVTDAISVLAGFNDLRVIEPFIALFKVKNVNIRLAALSGLSRYKDDRVLKALEGLLGDKAPAVRSRAAGALGKWGDAGAAESLQAALKKEKVGKVQRAIIAALKKLDTGVPGDEQ